MPRAALLLLAALFILSCTDVDAVARFARGCHDAGIALHGIASDSVPSCERAVSFVLPGQDKPDCDAFERISPPVLQVNDALFGYLSALGNLAGADTVKATSGLNNIQTTLKAADSHLSATDLSQAGAAAGLASLLTRLATNHYREREVRKVMREADSAVQQTAGFLAVYAAGKYEQGLRDERTRGRAFCTDRIRAGREQEPLTAILFARGCDADRATLDKKLAGVGAYRRAVQSAAATHHKLATTEVKWNAQFVRGLLPDVQQLADAAQAAANAF